MGKWLEVVQDEELSKLNENAVGLKKLEEKRVCSKHFLPSDFVHSSTRRLLKPGTVPQSSLSILVPEVISNLSNNVTGNVPSNESSLNESIHVNSFDENRLESGLNESIHVNSFDENALESSLNESIHVNSFDKNTLESSLNESIHVNSFDENALSSAVNLETVPEQSNDDDVSAAGTENNASLPFNLLNQQAPIKRKRKKNVLHSFPQL